MKNIMTPNTQSHVFNINIFFWKVFGMWPVETSSIYYKVYGAIFLFNMTVLYLLLFALSLMFTPIEIEIITAQATFFFTEIAGKTKMYMVCFGHSGIDKVFEMLDREEFQGDDDVTKDIVNKNKEYYRKVWKFIAGLYYGGVFFLLFLPIIYYWIGRADLELPLCQYYFLSDEIRHTWFIVIYAFQFCGLVVLSTCNVNIDTFIFGLLLMAITQFKVLNHKLSNLKLTALDMENKSSDKEDVMKTKLNNCLRHYDRVLEYCDEIQDLMSAAIFAQFGTGAATICISMCSLLRPMTAEEMVFQGFYIGAMTLEIFLPSLLGANLTYESQKLVAAAYAADWTPRSESFKRSLRLLVERANTPIVISGLKMFTLSLVTFTSIIKTAYSFFTLLKNMQETN